MTLSVPAKMSADAWRRTGAHLTPLRSQASADIYAGTQSQPEMPKVPRLPRKRQLGLIAHPFLLSGIMLPSKKAVIECHYTGI